MIVCLHSGDPTPPAPSPRKSGDDRQGGHGALGFGFGHYGVEVVEDLGDGHGVDLAAGVAAFFDDLLEVAAGDLRGELVGNDLAGALLLPGPGVQRQGDPHGAAVDVEAAVDGVGGAGGGGDDGGASSRG